MVLGGVGLQKLTSGILDLSSPLPRTNTTLVMVATDAVLSKTEAAKVARMAHSGLSQTISTSHTAYNGDVVFVLGTGPLCPSMLDLIVRGPRPDTLRLFEM